MNARTGTPSFSAQAVMFAGTALVMLGNYYGYDSIAPVAEQLSRELHYSDTQIGTLNAIYSLPNIFLVLVGGVLVDRFSARAMVLATTALCLVGAIVPPSGSTLWSWPWGGCCSASARKPSSWPSRWRSPSGSRAATSRCCSPST